MKIKELLKQPEINIVSDYNEPSTYTAIINGSILNPFEELQKADILIYDDKIIAIDEINDISSIKKVAVIDAINDISSIKKVAVIDAKDMTITPGLIDQHVHGGYGCNFNSSSEQEMLNFLKNITKHGVTSLFATLMTDSAEKIKEQIEIIKKIASNKNHIGAKILGIHLEGPFLNPKYKGIHPEYQILTPSIDNYNKLKDDLIKIVSYAPELDENFEFTKYLTSNGIIASAGHTDIDFESTEKAVKSGLKQLTHSFNAMRPLHHREPGVLGQMLTDDNLFVEIIADCMHVHPCILKIIKKLKPREKIIFVSDSIPLNSSTCDIIEFGGQNVYKKDNRAVNETGTMAGSIMFLDDIFRNIQNQNIFTFSEFIGYASLNPAINCNLKNLGQLQVGYIADIAIWNKKFEPTISIINGIVVN